MPAASWSVAMSSQPSSAMWYPSFAAASSSSTRHGLAQQELGFVESLCPSTSHPDMEMLLAALRASNNAEQSGFSLSYSLSEPIVNQQANIASLSRSAQLPTPSMGETDYFSTLGLASAADSMPPCTILRDLERPRSATVLGHDGNVRELASYNHGQHNRALEDYTQPLFDFE